MKVVLCEVCHRPLDETPEPNRAGRNACPYCGSVSRVYEEADNIVKCKNCGDIIYPVPFTFRDNGGLCDKCAGRSNPSAS